MNWQKLNTVPTCWLSAKKFYCFWWGEIIGHCLYKYSIVCFREGKKGPCLSLAESQYDTQPFSSLLATAVKQLHFSYFRLTLNFYVDTLHNVKVMVTEAASFFYILG